MFATRDNRDLTVLEMAKFCYFEWTILSGKFLYNNTLINFNKET